MKKALLLTTIGVLSFFTLLKAQNVFNPNDKVRRWVNNGTTYSNDSTAQAANPNPAIQGLQKWVSVKTSGIDSAVWGKDYKPYYINISGFGVSFRVMYPKSYGNPDSAGKKYPVMLFFHGAGEPGCPANGGIYNNEKQMVHGGQFFHDAVAANKFDGFLLYPQAVVADNSCWSDWGLAPYSPYYNVVINMLDSMAKYTRLDVDRVFLDGLSNGGYAVWTMTNIYPQRVTKAAPSSSAATASNYSDFVHIPIWFATGGKDTNPTPGWAQATYDAVKGAGADIRYTLYPDLGHFVWTTHWSEPDFIPFMNDLHKANPLVYFQRYDFCPDSAINTKIGITAGFYAYEWQKDGVTIATRTNGVNTIVDGTSIISYTGNDVTVKSFGTYRVRFKRTATSDWSLWSPKPAVIFPKTVTVTPPIAVNGIRSRVLPAEDGSNTVPLMLPAGYSGYQWIRILDNAIVSTTNTYTAPVGQYKAKIIEQFGCGSNFSPIFNVASVNGTPQPDPAKNLAAYAATVTSIQLDWNENPNAGENETGFEIYRSKFAGGPYQLVTITAPNVVSYIDAGLASNTTYYYIVRAVGDFGAGAPTNEASATTGQDLVAPAPPSGLTVTCASRSNVSLKWTAATDNIGVTAYDIFINGSKSYTTSGTSFSINELNAATSYTFTVKARDAAGNISQASNQVVAQTFQQGVCYKYYLNTPGLASMPDYNSLTPTAAGIATNFAFSGGGAGTDNFGYLWEGYVKVTTGGSYRFQTCSDDGSKLYFNMPYNANATETVDNDGLHGVGTCVTSAAVTLTAGTYYPISVAFFEAGGSEAINVNWSLGAGAFAAIPNANLTETFTAGTPPLAPTGLTATATGSDRIRLNWTDASNNETGFEVVRSTTLNGTYNPVATVAAAAVTFTDSGLNASTAYFYKIRSIGTGGQSAFTTSATATTQAGPAIPLAPSGMVATVLAKDIIKVDWADNSSNETSFELWRSVGTAANFRLFKTINGGSGATKSFTDSSLFANVTYYYKVRAVGAGGSSAYAAQVSATTLNTRPSMTHVLDFTMKYGTTFSMPINAVDGDGDQLSFSMDYLPSFAYIQNVSNGNANLVLSPTVGDQGAYSFTCYVNDGHNGFDTTTFTMLVNDNTVPTLDTITDKVLDEGKTLVIPVRANDAEGNNYMVWTFDNKPSFATFVDSGNGRGSITLSPGYSASGPYIMTVFADDGNGAWTSRTFKITVNEFDPNDNIRVNFKYFTGSSAPWNDVDLFNLPTPFNRGNLVNSKGVTTTVGVNALSSNYNGAGGGAQTGNNSGVYPDNVMHDYLEWGKFAFGTSDTLRLRVYGLDTARRYNMVFFASSTDNCCGINANTVTTYKIGNDVATVHHYLNTVETDTIYQVKPNTAGEIFITMIGDPNSLAGGLLNSLVINAAYDDGSAPAKPLNLEAGFEENSGVRLTWQDRAYNEFKYSVYRSTSQAGPYTLLNPLGQNSDSTGYTDLTASQYTNYFYYVVGVNNHGAGQTSDTVSIKTGNNRPVIGGVQNFTVKAGNTFQEDFTVTDVVTDNVQVSIDNKPAFVVLDNLGNGNYRITATPTIDNVGQEFLTIKATDNKGGVSTYQVIITVTDRLLNKTVMVNFGEFSKTAPAPWNNFLHYGSAGVAINNLIDATGAPTTIGMQMVEGWNGMFLTGHITGNNSGVVCDSVLQSGIYYTGAVSATRSITITGLDPTKRYNIVVVGSQNEGLDATMRVLSSVGGLDTLNARNNTNMTANLNGLVPPANGTITLTLGKLLTTGVATNSIYLNAIILEEYVPAAFTILNPINLYVEPKDRTTTVLSWSDRSNNENAADGFQLQRATDSLFTVNVTNITIGGNNSTYTNTGLTANTKYFYRIRAKTGASTFSDWSNAVKTITPQSMIFVNFNQNVQSAGSPWNNLAAFPDVNVVYANLQNQSNVNTGYSLSIVRPFNGENNAGKTTGNNTGMGGLVPDLVLQSGYWMDNLQLSQVKISGLNQTKRYRIGFISSSNWIGGDLTATFTVNGKTVYINSWQNTNKIVYLGDLVPDANGELLLSISTTNAAANAYSSGLIISAYDDVNGGAVLNAPSHNPLVSSAIPEETNPAQTGKEKVLTQLSVYPNPFVEDISIDFNNTTTGQQAQIELYDIAGRLMMTKNYGNLQKGAQSLRLYTSDAKLVPGVYMVTLVIDGKTVAVEKLVKTKK